MIAFGREITGHFAAAASREWLVTNGLGGWASGTVSGANTRRYHGFFVPALQPPLGRTVLVSKLEEWVRQRGRIFPLSSNEYVGGHVDPAGHRHIESFRLDRTVPTWTYALAGSLLEKRVWMAHGRNLVFAAYTLARGTEPLELDVQVMITERDAHSETRTDAPPPAIVAGESHGAASVCVHGRRAEWWLIANGGRFEADLSWRPAVWHRVEHERGLPASEPHFAIGRFVARLQPGDTWVLAATLDGAEPPDWSAAFAAEQARAHQLIEQAALGAGPEWIKQLVLAADQFLVRRDEGLTVIAGYPWFADWGRDTMIALPGLTLSTRRLAEARNLLWSIARFVDQGMLPNRFPDSGERPDYNTADATLWYFHALDRYVSISGDLDFARQLLPVLEDIVHWHCQGTRYGIGRDPADGLLRAGEPGTQLTWMDVRIGDWTVTPRVGKPVEVNALWINALRVMEALTRRLGVTAGHPYGDLAQQAEVSFGRFWYPAGRHLFDVIDGLDASDPTLRPNQLLAVSLPHGPLAGRAAQPQARAIVTACAEHLLTSFGLRSLAPGDPAYEGRFTGSQYQRDAAYHQGTVWAWLMGPFVDAHHVAFGDPAVALSFLAPFETHLAEDGLGSIAEVFEGDPPHQPRGCPAQAWSVGEVLRAWRATFEACQPTAGQDRSAAE